jgi:hypothetical protein
MSRNWIAAAAIVVLAIVPRVSHLRSLALDNDEIAEATWSSLPFAEMMAKVRNDSVHPPADYIVQWFAGRLGPEWVRRMPSVIAGVATVAVVIALGATWVSPAAGLAAGFLLAISPTHIFYSQTVRPYAAALFFIVASLLALEKRRYGFWSALVFLAGSTLYFAGVVAAIGGLLRMPIRKFAMHALAWTLLYLPWLPVVYHAAHIPSPLPRQHLGWSWWRWRLETLGAGNERFVDAPVSIGSWVFWLLVAAGLAACIRYRGLRLPAFVFLAGTAFEIILLQIHPHYEAVRYLLPSWIVSFVLAGAAMQMSKPVGVTMCAVFACFALLTIDDYPRNRSDWRAVAMYVHDRVRSGETIYVTNGWVVRNFGYYWQQMPPIEGIALERYYADEREVQGPAWIITGGCLPREAARAAPLMMQSRSAEWAEVRYLRAHQQMKRLEICTD